MRKHYFLGIIIFVVVTFFSVNVFGKGDVRRGEAKYKVCAACHGENGEGSKIANAPRISGQHSWYLARQLKILRMVCVERILMILLECKCVQLP